jgi:hypothetical protein
MTGARFIAALLAASALAGCGTPLFRPDEAHEVAGLLANYRSAGALPAEDQRRELAAAQAAYDKAQNDSTRLALALAMLLPQSAAARDETRLQSLLGAVSAGTGGRASARYDLAQTLLALLQREQRKQDQLAHQLREERKRGEEMQQKIDSLRAIDRDIRSRRNQ